MDVARTLFAVALVVAACQAPPTPAAIDAAAADGPDAATEPPVDATPPDAEPPPACGTAELPPCAAFVDVTETAGVAGDLPGSTSGDVVAFDDFDGDGLIDLARSGGDGLHVWRNTGAGQLVAAEAALGLADARAEDVIVPADVDGDGWVDLLLMADGYAEVYRGGATGFTLAEGALPALDWTRAATAAIADWDGDGDLDIFATGDPTLATPGYLLENLGDGTFADATAAAGLTATGTLTLQALWVDAEADGDPDLVLANDRGGATGFRTQLFRNDDGVLTDVTDTAGMGPLIEGMGIASGDIDGDGDFDLYISNSPDVPDPGDGHLLLINDGTGVFSDVGRALGVHGNVLGWGVAMLDFENDGDLDLLAIADATGGPPGTRAFENLGGGEFRDVTEAIGLADPTDGYGVSVADYDGDGFIDIAVAHTVLGAPVTLYRNAGSPYHWLALRLRGAAPNTRGIGAVVTARIGDRVLVRSNDAGSGFGGANPPEVLLGLGTARTVDHLEVRWPTGAVTVLENVDADQRIDVDE